MVARGFIVAYPKGKIGLLDSTGGRRYEIPAYNGADKQC
uniref:Uncharacterized protein n=2 Tax=Bacteria TaxID=2 RepID=E7C421_9GAMM|nr:hypothetical protein [uncultured gamma proteobacterium HF0200_34B07]ADI22291.1 hypothetical protein [uncultured actinobacterium HF0200_46I24]